MSIKNDALVVGGVALAIIFVGWYAKKAIGDALSAGADWVAQGAKTVVNTAGEQLQVATAPGALNVQGTIHTFQTLNGPDPANNMTEQQAQLIELLALGSMGA